MKLQDIQRGSYSLSLENSNHKEIYKIKYLKEIKEETSQLLKYISDKQTYSRVCAKGPFTIGARSEVTK